LWTLIQPLLRPPKLRRLRYPEDKPLTNRSVLTGIPFALILTGATRHDVTQTLPLIDALSPIRGKRGRPLSKPVTGQGDRGYDH
jgi:hypothetical protein